MLLSNLREHELWPFFLLVHECVHLLKVVQEGREGFLQVLVLASHLEVMLELSKALEEPPTAKVKRWQGALESRSLF